MKRKLLYKRVGKKRGQRVSKKRFGRKGGNGMEKMER